MSRQSEYSIDLVVKGDEARAAIDQINKGLDGVTKHAKNAENGIDIAGNLEQAAEAAKKVAIQFHNAVMQSDGDGEDYFKAYTRGVEKAEKTLQAHATRIQHSMSDEGKQQRNELSQLKQARFMARTKEEEKAILEKIKILSAQVIDLSDEELQKALMKNRQTRVTLRNTIQAVKYNQAASKLADKEQKQGQSRIRTMAAWVKQLVSGNDQVDAMLKRQEKILKTVSATEKQQKAVTRAIKDSERAQSRLSKIGSTIGKAIQTTYNVTGLVGGVGRAFGSAGQAISNASAVADREVEKERLANRVKGFNMDDAKDILGQLYIQTGADYSVIVEAINRVQNVLKSNDKEDLIAAATTEIRYPGSAQAFASSNTEATAANFTKFGNRLKAMQNATGASDEQVQSSMEKINNMRPGDFGSAKISELQTVYLGLQNSGAFDSLEELDKAFKSFVSTQKNSGKDVFEFAQKYDWNGHISGERNRLQASHTLSNIDWGKMGSRMKKLDEQGKPEQSDSESMAIKMRQMEEKKNQLMIKLIPAIQPIVEKIAELLTGDTASQIIDGFVNLFKAVIPALEPIFVILEPVLKVVSKVLNWLNDEVIPRLLSVFHSIANWFGDDDNQTSNATPQNAAGGLAFMPSIVGERGPEAIIPLDYSRAQRAENIANTVNQTFNMGGNQTTALSLAQAVRSRDFTRAMTDNQFFTRRCGAF